MTIEAVGEALLFAAKAGDDPSRAPGLDGRLPCSKVLEVHGDRMVKRTFDPGFRIARDQNDLNLAPTAARQMGASPPNTATRQELFNACAALGGSAWDRSAKIKALELLSGCEVA